MKQAATTPATYYHHKKSEKCIPHAETHSTNQCRKNRDSKLPNRRNRNKFHRGNGEYTKNTELDTEVGVLKVRPGMTPEEIDFLIEQDYSGVVIEGTGLGHMPVDAFDDKTQHHAEILEKVSELAEDTAVVLASQCLNGRVDMNVYDAGIKIQDAGVIQSKDMHPELAYVKLMWSLGQTDSIEEAKELFQKDINGEITERSMYSGDE